MKKEITPNAMLVRLAGLCAAAEQCSGDLRSKILKKGFSQDQANSMLSYLTANGYVDDSRYAKAYASDKVRFSGWGKMKIRMALRVKGISDSNISAALANISVSDYDAALNKALSAKACDLNLSDVRDRQRLYRNLASRGFESAVIIPAIRRYIASQADC